MNKQESDPTPVDSTEDIQPAGRVTATARWRQIALATWNKLFDDEMFGRAAQLAYYWFFSIFPLMIFVTALLSFSPMSRNLERWLTFIRNILPPQAFTIVRTTFREVAMKQQPGLLSISILVLIWASSTGMGSVITALNKAYDVPQPRPWWIERLLAIVLTIGLTIFINTSLLLIFFGDRISTWLAGTLGLGSTFMALWDLIQWPLVIIFVLVGIELIYYFAPNIRQRWNLFTPGAILALIFWLTISLGFRFYVMNFSNYNATYGTLGGVMVLMLWLYLTGVAILVGGVVNSVILKLD